MDLASDLRVCALRSCGSPIRGLRPWQALYCSDRCRAFARSDRPKSVDAHRPRRVVSAYAPQPRVQGDISEAEVDRLFHGHLKAIRASGQFQLDPHQRVASVDDADSGL